MCCMRVCLFYVLLALIIHVVLRLSYHDLPLTCFYAVRLGQEACLRGGISPSGKDDDPCCSADGIAYPKPWLHQAPSGSALMCLLRVAATYHCRGCDLCVSLLLRRVRVQLLYAGTDAGDMLDNRVIPLKRGFVGVINRGQKDIDEGVSIRQASFCFVVVAVGHLSRGVCYRLSWYQGSTVCRWRPLKFLHG